MKPTRKKDRKKPRDVFAVFAPPVRRRLKEYRRDRQLSHSAYRLGFHPARLSEMITRDRKGEYKRKITPYYLAKFIEGGIITIPELLGKKKIENLPEKARMFFERMLVPRKTLQLVIEAKRRGIDVEGILSKKLSRRRRK